MSDRFLYEIHPVRPFNTKDGKLIKKACSALLTKDEVKEYMKICPIYRKVSGATNKMIRVTLSNLDELHTPTGKATVAVVKEEVVTHDSTPEKVEKTPVDTETVVEDNSTVDASPEPIEEVTTPVVEEEAPVTASPETVEETPVTTEPTAEEVVTTEEESSEEVSVEDENPTESVDDILEGAIQTSNNYQGKKKHKHH